MAIVDAVPMTMQVPAVGHSAPSTEAMSSAPSTPARCSAQYARQSVHAPVRRPRHSPASIGPDTTCTAGTPADAAAIRCAGTVLSQPPTSTTASRGWERSCSSSAMAARLR